MTTLSEPFVADSVRGCRLGLVLALFCLLLAPIGLLAEKGVVPLVIAAALGGGLLAGPAGRPWHLVDRDLALAIGLLTAWCVVSGLWSIAPPAATVFALRIGALLLLLVYLSGLAGLLDDAQRQRAGLWFAVGVGVTVAIILVEFAFGFPIFTLLRGPAGNAYTAFSRLNRGVSAVAILAWPLAALIWYRGRHRAALAVPPAIFAVTLLSQSSASMFGLGAGLLCGAAACLGRGLSRLIIVAAVVGTLFGSPLAVELMQRAGLEQADFVPDTGRYRLHFWKVINARIFDRPVAGWGFDSSSVLPTGNAKPFRPGESVIPLHPHNGALQIMVELGVIGSLLSAAVLFLIAGRIDRLAPPARSFAVAMVVTVLGIAVTAYGIWQSHWLAMIGSAAAVFIIVRPREGPPVVRTSD